jgi:hypothetical protein
MGAMKQKTRLKQILWQHIKRGGFYQNNQEIDGTNKLADFVSPDHVGEYVRAAFLSGIRSTIILWPFLLFSDLFALLGLLINLFYTWKQPDSCDDDNDIMSYLLAKHSLPTPISFLVRKLYKRYRPICIGGWDMNGPQSACSRKHRSTTGSPPFYDLYKDELKNL